MRLALWIKSVNIVKFLPFGWIPVIDMYLYQNVELLALKPDCKTSYVLQWSF